MTSRTMCRALEVHREARLLTTPARRALSACNPLRTKPVGGLASSATAASALEGATGTATGTVPGILAQVNLRHGYLVEPQTADLAEPEVR